MSSLINYQILTDGLILKDITFKDQRICRGFLVGHGWSCKVVHVLVGKPMQFYVSQNLKYYTRRKYESFT